MEESTVHAVVVGIPTGGGKYCTYSSGGHTNWWKKVIVHNKYESHVGVECDVSILKWQFI